MTEPAVAHANFTIHRTLPVSPSIVFQAFADADLKRRWFAEGDHHDVEEFSGALHEGAVERLRYRFRDGTPFAGLAVESRDTVLNVIPDRLIIWASKMAFNGGEISTALTTAELVPVADGTELFLTFQGAFFEGADGPQIREMGWATLLDRLAAVLD